ncbi:hypothetical protein ZOSMA_183G00360 [Zostera marina]|uniref:Uncharacterized protein n=1 Tax=Zostera marina TaxID=29655 RepID=A0A0K9PSU0_ZOSMR|nr:hypothetical protein ZOSMA_183G00360 [Zostera marina]
MASFYRSVAIAVIRSASVRSKTTSIPMSFLNPTFKSSTPLISRTVYATLRTVGSMIPLHTAVSSARLNSCITLDSSCLSFFPQGLMDDN